MKLISWNVNGLRACLNKGFLDFFRRESPDFLCLPETKMVQGQAQLDLGEGWLEFWNSAEKKGYSGTAVFTTHAPLNVAYGMDKDIHDTRGGSSLWSMTSSIWSAATPQMLKTA